MGIHPEVEADPLSPDFEAPPPPPKGSDHITAGALLSLIAHSYHMSIPDLLLTAQVAPRKLLCLLKELRGAELIEVEGIKDLSELDDVFARNQTQEFDSSEIPYLKDRRNLMNELEARKPGPIVSISRKGFARALVL